MILEDKVEKILADIKSCNGVILLEDDNLKLSFPDDFNNLDLLEAIKLNKKLLVEELKSRGSIPRTSRESLFFTTLGQKGVWILSQLENGSNAYHINTIFDLYGVVDSRILKKSVSILIKRHEILRTTFYTEGEELFQKIHKESVLNFPFEETEENKPIVIKKLIEDHSNQLFDFEKESLFRFLLIKEREDKYILGLTLHHIISDGWSIGVLISELLQIYIGLSKGLNNVLFPLKFQYKDYAEWQRKQFDYMTESQRYWKEKLSGELPILELSGYQIRPTVKTYHGNRVLFSIEKNKVFKWKEIIKENGSTLFMGLLAGLNAILYRYTSQEKFIIGTPVAGRNHKELSNQIGFYINVLPLMLQVAPENSYLDLLSEVKETTLKAFEHQRYPFDKILKDINIQKDISRNPLFDCILVLQNNEKIDVESQGLKVEQRKNISKTSKYDFSFLFTEVENGDLCLELEYNTDLYKKEFINQLGTHYINMMDAMVTNEKCSIGFLEYLSDQEKQQLLIDFNNTKVDYSKDKTVVDLFEEQVEKTPDKIAIVFEEKELTYRQLDNLSNQLGHYLKDTYKIKPDRLVGIKLERSEWMLISILGILKSGGAYVPIDPKYPEDRIRYIEDNSNCNVVIDIEELKRFEILQPKLLSKKLNLKRTSSDIAYVIYTSGSTGEPKGCILEHRQLMSFLKNIEYNLGMKDIKRVAATTMISFDISILELLGSIVIGKELYIYSDEALQNPELLLSLLKKNKIEFLQLTPSRLGQLFLVDQEFPKTIKILLVGGETLTKQLCNKINNLKNVKRAINVYGPTETTIWSTFSEIKKGKQLTIGKPLANESVYILDSNNQLNGIYTLGEICIGGDGLSRGYLNKPELTADKFVMHPLKKGERIYKTGDLGRWLPDGNIEFVGRNDQQVKIRGHRIELGEIESLLGNHELISECVVVVKESGSHNKLLIAYIVEKYELNISELVTYLKRSLPEYMIPSYFIKLSEIPLTPNGKIDRKSLPNATGEEGIVKKEYVAPRNEMEKKLVSIWSEVLDYERGKIGIQDDFFDLGGNSLTINILRHKIKEKLNLELNFKTLFENRKIIDQSNILIEFTVKKNSSIIEINLDKYLLKPTPSQERLLILSNVEEASTAYNLLVKLKIVGKVSFELIKESFEVLIENNEILRTSFNLSEEGRYETKIFSKIETPFFFIDKKNKIDIDVEDEMLNRPIQIDKPGLLRLYLKRDTNNSFILFLSMHHIIGDGWSIEIFFKELFEIYSSLLLGNKAPVKKEVQFSHFSAFYYNYLDSDKYFEDKQYWVNKHQIKSSNVIISQRNKRPKIKTYNGDNYYHEFSIKKTNIVENIARRHNTSKFLILLASFYSNLWRHSGTDDITIGVPTSGREVSSLYDQIGYYVNVLPFRLQGLKDVLIGDMINSITSEWMEAYDHQLFPMDHLLTELSQKRDFSRNPLFDFSIAYQNYNFIRDMNYDDLEISIEKPQFPFSRFDLSFFFSDDEKGRLNLKVEYNTDLYSQSYIKHFVNDFERILDIISKDDFNKKLNDLRYYNFNLKKQFNNELSTQFSINDVFTSELERVDDSVAIIEQNNINFYNEVSELKDNFWFNLLKFKSDNGLLISCIGLNLERSFDLKEEDEILISLSSSHLIPYLRHRKYYSSNYDETLDLMGKDDFDVLIIDNFQFSKLYNTNYKNKIKGIPKKIILTGSFSIEFFLSDDIFSSKHQVYYCFSSNQKRIPYGVAKIDSTINSNQNFKIQKTLPSEFYKIKSNDFVLNDYIYGDICIFDSRGKFIDRTGTTGFALDQELYLINQSHDVIYINGISIDFNIISKKILTKLNDKISINFINSFPRLELNRSSNIEEDLLNMSDSQITYFIEENVFLFNSEIKDEIGGDITERLKTIWRTVLKIDKDIYLDDFYILGGDSQKFIQLISRINREFNLIVPISEFFSLTTIKEQFRYIKSRLSTDKTEEISLIESNDPKIIYFNSYEQDRQNVFLIHDGTGNVFGYNVFCKILQNKYNFIGINADDIDSCAPKLIDFIELAEKYFKKIQKIQNGGTFHIGGWSIGGNIVPFLMNLIEKHFPNEKHSFSIFDSFFNVGLPAVNDFNYDTEYEMISNLYKKHDLGILKRKGDLESLWKDVISRLKKVHDEKIENIFTQFNGFNELLGKYNQNFELENYISQLNFARSLFVSAQIMEVNFKLKSKLIYYRPEFSDNDSLNWGSVLERNLVLINVKGDHFSMFKEPQVYILTSLFKI